MPQVMSSKHPRRRLRKLIGELYLGRAIDSQSFRELTSIRPDDWKECPL